MASSKTTELLAAQRFAALAATPLVAIGGAYLLGDQQLAPHIRHYGPDLTGLEAFVNHFHLSDVLGVAQIPRFRVQLFDLGEMLISIWNDRLRAAGVEVPILFYLGGEDDVTIRFHLERADGPWVDLNDRDFLARADLRVYRGEGRSVRRLA